MAGQQAWRRKQKPTGALRASSVIAGGDAAGTHLVEAGDAFLPRDAHEGVQRAAVARRLPEQLQPPVSLQPHLHNVRGRCNSLSDAACNGTSRDTFPQRRVFRVDAFADEQRAHGRVETHADAAIHGLPQRSCR